MAQLLFFGGSIVEGVGDPQGGWVDRFKHELHDKMYGVGTTSQIQPLHHHLYNLGIAGDTSAQIVERLPNEFAARQKTTQPMVVVISSGTNDSRAEDSPANFTSSPREYLVTMQSLVDYLQSYTPHILFIGLTPIDDTKTRPTAEKAYFSQARIKEFDDAMEELARSNHLPRVDLLNAMLSLDWRAMLSEDGLHPNEIGHEWIYQKIRQPVLELVATAEQRQ